MTELETQLADGLKRLSAQYEREQKQQRERIEHLQQQVQTLSAQVERLSEQHQKVIDALDEDYSA